jgi:DNA-binding MarR family transcriptional regulator
MPQLANLDLARILRDLATSLMRDTPPGRLSRTAAATLSALDRLGPQRITTLARHESVTQPAMTGLVQRLEAAGLVERANDPDDGRASRIAITAAGTDALTTRRRGHDESIAARLAHLSAEDRAALDAAAPAITTLTEHHADNSH